MVKYCSKCIVKYNEFEIDAYNINFFLKEHIILIWKQHLKKIN